MSESDKPATQTPAATQNPAAQYPDTQAGATVGESAKMAGGLKAIFETIRTATHHGTMRAVRSLLVVNKKGGIDCPSCAWPDPDGERAIAEFCENGAKAIAWEATKKRVDRAFFAKHSIVELATHTEHWLGDQGRITEPFVRRPGQTHYEPIAWDDAIALVAAELNALDSPDEALFYTSGRASNEAAFCYQLFVRQLGTNNLPDCSNMCHESSGLGLSQSIGIGKGTVTLEDFAHADAIFIVGQNPGTNHPRMLSELEKAARRGCKIVSINPLKETGLVRFKHPQSPMGMLGSGTPIASLFVQVRVNGDAALYKGMMKELLERDRQSRGSILDHAFIEASTEGFAALAADLDATSWEEIVTESGVSLSVIREAADIAATSERLISCWAMGITQHKNGVANVQLIADLHLMRGQIGKPGQGLCPVRGHSNVQGDRTMGIWEKMSDGFMRALGEEFSFKPPAHHGLDTVGGFQAMHDGKIKVFVALGGNFLSAGPDTEFGAIAFSRTSLSVQISTKLNRNHLIGGKTALILPCLGRTELDMQAEGEQFVSCENSMGVVQQSRGVLAPASKDLLSETAIICRLAAATLGGRTSVAWEKLAANYDRIRQHIEHVIPGFADYNARVRQPGGFYLPNLPRDAREFPTDIKKAKFKVHPIAKLNLRPGELLMMSLRSHDQFNTTIYGEADRYRGISGGRRVVFVNPEDIAALHLTDGQWVDLESHYAGERRVAKRFRIVAYDIPRRCAATYFPEANPLVPLHHVADGSNQPASKSVAITLVPIS